MSVDPYAVRIRSGVLITCDSAAKQILLHLDREREGRFKFILRDVDDTHLMVESDQVEHIKDILQEELEKNTYSQNPEM